MEERVLGIGFDKEDMYNILAACKTMAVLFASSDNKDDVVQSLRLLRIVAKIETAIAVGEGKGTDSEGN